jgi:class 3 adenylate cyclase
MTKRKDPASLPSGLLTFMFTDIVGSTQMKDKMSGALSSERERAFLKLIKQPQEAIVAERVKARSGFIVKSTGDGFLTVFSDAEKAVLCAVEIQEKLKTAAIFTPDGLLQIRIGINSGPAEPKNGDYTSSTVDKASRVESNGSPGQVYLSGETHRLVQGKVRDIITASVGYYEMKGVGREELFVATRLGQTIPLKAKALSSQAGREPMSPPLEAVVIGDPDEERFGWFKKLLRDFYEVDAVQAKTYEQVKKLAEDQAVNFIDTIVFLSDDLPFSSFKANPDPNLNFVRLEQIAHYTDFVCIVTKETDPFLGGVERQPHHIHLSTWPPTEGDKQRVLNELGSLGSRLSRRMDLSAIDNITIWDKDNRVLHQRVCSLGENHAALEGKDTLLRLIRNCLDCHDAVSIEIKPLGQGKSGDSVFRLVIISGDQTKDYVLKISDALWRLRNEVRGHLEAQKDTDLPEYKQHVAALRKPIHPIKSADPGDHFKDQFIVNSGQWYAIHCDFLGGATFGKFIDPETVLTAGPLTLQEKTKDTLPTYRLTSNEPDKVLAHRLRIFGAILDGLSEIWYGKKRAAGRTLETVWRVEDRQEQDPVRLPPYQLTRRVKGLVQDFLESREAALGPRLFPRWNYCAENTLKLVSDKATAAELGLGYSIPFKLSPVHGDLNANNVLLWLDHEKYPFVIDLPSYQKDGHSLQDFARLEVEIKLSVLDRQEESPVDQLAAYDYTPSQIPLWIEMEDLLLESRALDEARLGSMRVRQVNWKAPGYSMNVDLTYRLVMLLRQKACAIQQMKLDELSKAVPFGIEYLPALLYHTVRAIGDASLSVFKRLLAIYTVGSILERLK